MTRHLRTLTLAVSILLAALAVAAGPALARSRSRTVAVPRLSGDVTHAYTVLRRDGFKVSIPRSFTLGNAAVTSVTRVSPKPGRRLRRGSVVTLSLRCCGRLSHLPALGAYDATRLPQMKGSTMTQVAGWARTQGRRYRATFAPLRAATGATLLGDYVVTHQSIPVSDDLKGATVLGLAAHPGQPAQCAAPYYAQTVQRDSQAVVYDVTAAPLEPTADIDYYGCVQAQNVERQLIRTNVIGATDTRLVGGVVSGTRFLAFDQNGPGKYGQGPPATNILSWDLTTGRRTQVYSAGTTAVDDLVANPQGFAAWRATTTPASTSTALAGISCPTPGFCAAADAKGSVFTSSAPTGGRAAWTQTQLPTGQLNAIACPSTGLCVVAGNGQLLVSTSPAGGAQTWTSVGLADNFTSVACASSSLCVAVGGNEIATSTDPSNPAAWTLGSASASGLNAVACPSTTLCVASSTSGNVLTSTAPAGGASTWSAAQIDDRGLSGVACGSPSLCITGDGSGDIFAAANPAGGVPAWSVTATGLNAPGPFTCASNNLCVAGVAQGLIVSTTPTGPASSWSPVPFPTSLYFPGVSCATGGGLCAAVDPSGNIVTSTNPAGGAGAWSSAAVDALPCVASGGCQSESIMARDSSGLRTLDTTGPGNGLQLQKLTLTGNTLSWTSNGTARTATLG